MKQYSFFCPQVSLPPPTIKMVMGLKKGCSLANNSVGEVAIREPTRPPV